MDILSGSPRLVAHLVLVVFDEARLLDQIEIGLLDRLTDLGQPKLVLMAASLAERDFASRSAASLLIASRMMDAVVRKGQPQ